ncbi:putative oxalocrotonate tautomerase [Phyllosticta citribraziliensis]|uniref:Oxalocrotonate tautomerase n=1 Tax=Phyllosticta citribraziliensis TaxID=989973 RepID=A0ABR1LB02_9PEZI
MPRWTIYHSDADTGALATPAARAALARAITALYTRVGLPAFYVVVLFHALPPTQLYVGGEANDGVRRRPFVRLAFEHVARAFESREMKERFLAKIDEVLKPHLLDQGYDYEYTGADTDRDLWRINGVAPPREDTPAFEAWKRENRAVPLESL